MSKNKLCTTIVIIALILFLSAGCIAPAPQLTVTLTPAATLMATVTLQPTYTSTPEKTPTPDTPESKLPAENKANIDHVETLPDGRTVAIEKITPDQIAAGELPMLRVLQWDGKEWVKYVPKIGYYYPYEGRYDGEKWMANTEIPSITNPLIDKNGYKFPLGIIGIRNGKNSINNYVSGVITDVRTNIEQTCVEYIIAVPTKTGDYLLIYDNWSNNSHQQLVQRTITSNYIDGKKLLNNTFLPEESRDWEKDDPNYSLDTEQPIAEYFQNHDMVGTQISFNLQTPLNAEPDFEQKYLDILNGKSDVSVNTGIHESNTYIFPQSMEEIFNQP